MEVIRLNEELNVMNKKLKDSILTIENLTISKERNRIAQEIHDTLGHCLTALVMHLEFLKKISDKENTKNLELIKKTENIARESMKELRKAVYALKEDEDIYKDFKFSLNNMAENISLNDIKVDFDFIGNVNELKLELKNIIFKTLQEIITNSLKHGKAKKINIKLKVTRIVVSIEAADDGIGCEDIIMGNGLKGIEQRFLSLGGIVNFNPEKNKGFSIKAVIPL
jgi:signal transduction histidine kinase